VTKCPFDFCGKYWSTKNEENWRKCFEVLIFMVSFQE